MNNQLNLTVNNLLEREYFKNVEVYSNKESLNNIIKWTHIIESEKYIYTLNGGELILTTGVGLESKNNSDVFFIKELIKKKVAAICIELGNNFKFISEEIIKLSEDANIPIIIFYDAVKFVEITHDIHKVIINNHYLTLNHLYTLLKKFNEMSLLPNGILKILKEIFMNFKTPVFYIQSEGSNVYYPPEAKKDMVELQKNFEKSSIKQNKIEINNKFFIILETRNISKVKSYLCVEMVDEFNVSFINTVLEQASLAISQIILRNEIFDEKERYTEEELVQNLLYKTSESIEDLDRVLPFSLQSAQFRVLVIMLNHKNENSKLKFNGFNESKLRISSKIRKIFTGNNLYPIISIKEDEIRIISFSVGNIESNSIKNKYKQIHKDITNHLGLQNLIQENYYVGIGRTYNIYNEIPKSYLEAKRVAEFVNHNIKHVELYDDLGIYEIISQLDSKKQIKSFINTHLVDLIEPKSKDNETLLKTLEAFLDSNCSHKIASKELSIVRQTLYYRLNKIEKILGKDFLDSSKRLAIEVSIKAYRYLSSYE